MGLEDLQNSWFFLCVFASYGFLSENQMASIKCLRETLHLQSNTSAKKLQIVPKMNYSLLSKWEFKLIGIIMVFFLKYYCTRL